MPHKQMGYGRGILGRRTVTTTEFHYTYRLKPEMYAKTTIGVCQGVTYRTKAEMYAQYKQSGDVRGAFK